MPLPDTISRLTLMTVLSEVELLEARVAQGVETVVDTEFFVGEAGVLFVDQRSKGFD